MKYMTDTQIHYFDESIHFWRGTIAGESIVGNKACGTMYE